MERFYEPMIRLIVCPHKKSIKDAEMKDVPLGVLVNPTADQEQEAMDYLTTRINHDFYDVAEMRVIHVPIICPGNPFDNYRDISNAFLKGMESSLLFLVNPGGQNENAGTTREGSP